MSDATLMLPWPVPIPAALVWFCRWQFTKGRFIHSLRGPMNRKEFIAFAPLPHRDICQCPVCIERSL